MALAQADIEQIQILITIAKQTGIRLWIDDISLLRLPNTVTIEKLSYGVSYAINPVIVKFMENLRYIDKLGRGLPMVYKIAKDNHKKHYVWRNWWRV